MVERDLPRTVAVRPDDVRGHREHAGVARRVDGRLVGDALAGEQRPEDPWDDIRGLEVGARLEWRWDRFSFALMDFYGYSDFPYADRLFQYSRNVDPRTGRPREAMRTGECRTGTEDACLEPGEALRGKVEEAVRLCPRQAISIQEE